MLRRRVEDYRSTAKLKKLFEMRKANQKKRVILPDPVFNDVKVSKFVNHLMYDGKKNLSYEIFYAALETVKLKWPMRKKVHWKFGRPLWIR